ncbi:MAG: TonB-dependent receptor domain-containing protein [Bryobacteraceae bacterium]
MLLLTTLCAVAQETRGSMTGRVVDSTDSIIPNARVEALNVATGTVVSSTTNDAGSYDILYLLPGVYRVTVQAQGFKRAVRDQIPLRVNDRLALNFTLEVGDVSESVQVTAEAPLLETSTASTGRVMGQRQVTELPVVGGNAFYLSRLSAGVLSAGGRGNGQNPFDTGSSTTTIVVNGTRSGSSEVTLDGAPNMYNNTTAYAPPQDLVQEFKIHTAAYDASQGHAAGAVVNVSLKSGTNQLHGSGYYFDSRLRGRPWFLNRFLYDPRTGPITDRKIQEATPGWLHLRWGATATGPVTLPRLYDGRNRTFWSFGYEGVKIRRETTFTGTVPAAEQRRGDFSALLRLGGQYQIYDPATTVPAASGRFSRSPLPGNLIPQSRIDPIASKILGFYPEPNSPGTADGRQNYFRIADDDRRWGSLLGRLDHNFSERHRAFLRLNSNSWENVVQQMPTAANGNTNRRPGYGLVFDDVYVFDPQLLLNVRYGLTFQNPSTRQLSQGFDLLTLGFPSRLVSQIGQSSTPEGLAFPEIVIDGGAYTNLGAAGGNNQTFLYHNFTGTLTRIAGNHSFRLGGDFRVLRENAYTYGNVAPRLEFASTYTRGPLDNAAGAPVGQGLASLMLGIPSGGRVDVNASRAQQSTFTGFYLQDDWKLTPKLTLNIGLRYEYESPTTERFDRSIRGFDGATANPIEAQARANYAASPIPEIPASSFRTPGGLTFAGAGGLPRGLWSGDRNNVAPRIGLAWQLDRQTVIRTGYGIFYDLLGVDRQDVNQGGFNQSTNVVPTLDNGQTYRATLANPLPDGIETPPGATGGLRTFLGRGISFFHEQPRNAYMQRWSMLVQRELPWRVVASVSYVGNRGAKIAVARQLSPIPEQHLSRSPVRDQPVIDFLSAQVANPFFNIREFTGTGLAAQRAGRNQLLRPFPHFTGVTANLPAGFSYYHSLQVEVEKRMARGLMFLSTWTYSRFMEARTYQNDTDPIPEKLVSDLDFPHRFVVSAIYELPFGKGKPVLPNAGRLLDSAIGGWQLQGWFEGQSGDARGFGNAIFNGNLASIPLPVSERKAERWFNTDAGFERNAQRQLANNIQRFSSRFTGVRADGINNWDLSMFKNFALREGWKVQFRMESYNALNHVQFGAPNTAPANTAFGTITGEKGHGQRQVTFALKLLF